MILAAVVLGLLYGFLRKGNLASIFKKHFRLPALLFISLILEWISTADLVSQYLGSKQGYALFRMILAILQYSILMIFLWSNRKKPGMTCLMAGSVMNGLVIITNSGRMPIGVYIKNFGEAAVARIATAPEYFLAQGQEPFLFLADLIPFWTFGWYMISPGDILISIGMFRLAAYLTKRVLRRLYPEKDRSQEIPG